MDPFVLEFLRRKKTVFLEEFQWGKDFIAKIEGKAQDDEDLRALSRAERDKNAVCFHMAELMDLALESDNAALKILLCRIELLREIERKHAAIEEATRLDPRVAPETREKIASIEREIETLRANLPSW